jgi:hypothetical protein
MNGALRSAVDGARSRFEPEQRECSRTSDSAVPITYASGEVEMVPDSEIERREPMLESGFVSGRPPTSAPSRYGIAGPRGAVGALPYLALIGFVAVVTIGIFFGAGFSMLAPPSGPAVVDPGGRDPKRSDGNAALADRQIAPVLQEPAASGSAVVADIPRQLAQPPSIGNSAPVSPPAPPVTQPLSQIGPASGQPSALAPAMQAGPAPLATASTEPSSERADTADQEIRPAVRQGGDRLRAGRQPTHRHHKHAKKPVTFDKLITKLTREPNSVAPQLTPPRASLSPPDPGASQARR